MRRLVWILGWAAVAIWSLVAWGSYGLLNLFGDFAARNADVVTGQPEAVEWLSWGLGALQGLGSFAIVAVWAIVSLLILAVTAVLAKIAGVATTPQPRVGDYTYHVPPQPMPPQERRPERGPPSAVQDLMKRIEKR